MNRRDFLRSSAVMPPLAWLAHSRLLASAPPEAPVNTAPIVHGNTAFAADIYGQLGKKDGNLFYSPFSMSAALAMTSAGAATSTLDEIVKTFHFPDKQAELHAGFGSLSHQLIDAASKGGYEFRLANALWGHTGLSFREPFRNTVHQFYGAGFQTVDFGKPEAARQKINRWVEDQTKNRITDLFPSGSIDADTRLVLANAIYFKGTWLHQFQPSATSDAEFLSGGDKLKASMMHQTERFGYAETDEYQLLELRYQKSNLVMNVILPRATDGLPALEKKLNSDWLVQSASGMKPEKVILSLPRFKATIGYDLTGTLAAMGMPKAFSRSEADFSRMTDAERLMIGVVVHKAFVEVNEQGTEAAAATGVGIKMTSAQIEPPPKVFNANHPFLFAIRDSVSGSVLFLGRLTKPA
jgi:serpin B